MRTLVALLLVAAVHSSPVGFRFYGGDFDDRSDEYDSRSRGTTLTKLEPVRVIKTGDRSDERRYYDDSEDSRENRYRSNYQSPRRYNFRARYTRIRQSSESSYERPQYHPTKCPYGQFRSAYGRCVTHNFYESSRSPPTIYRAPAVVVEGLSGESIEYREPNTFSSYPAYNYNHRTTQKIYNAPKKRPIIYVVNYKSGNDQKGSQRNSLEGESTGSIAASDSNDLGPAASITPADEMQSIVTDSLRGDGIDAQSSIADELNSPDQLSGSTSTDLTSLPASQVGSVVDEPVSTDANAGSMNEQEKTHFNENNAQGSVADLSVDAAPPQESVNPDPGAKQETSTGDIQEHSLAADTVGETEAILGKQLGSEQGEVTENLKTETDVTLTDLVNHPVGESGTEVDGNVSSDTITASISEPTQTHFQEINIIQESLVDISDGQSSTHEPSKPDSNLVQEIDVTVTPEHSNNAGLVRDTDNLLGKQIETEAAEIETNKHEVQATGIGETEAETIEVGAAATDAASTQAAELETANQREAEHEVAEVAKAAEVEADKFETTELKATERDLAIVKVKKDETGAACSSGDTSLQSVASKLDENVLQDVTTVLVEEHSTKADAAGETESIVGKQLGTDAAEVGARELELTEPEIVKEEAVEAEAAGVEAAQLQAPEQEVIEVEAVQIEAGELEAVEVEAAEHEEVEQKANEVEAAELQEAGLEASEVEATELEAAELEAAELEAAELEAAEVEAAEFEVAELEAAELEAAEHEAAELDAAEVEATDLGAVQLEAAEVGTTELDAVDLEAAEVKTAELEAPEVVAAEIEAAEAETAEFKVNEQEAVEIEAVELRAAEVVAADVEAVEAEAAEVEAAEVGAAEAEAIVVQTIEQEATELEATEVETAETEAVEVVNAEARAAEVEAVEGNGAGAPNIELAEVEASESLAADIDAGEAEALVDEVFKILQSEVVEANEQPDGTQIETAVEAQLTVSGTQKEVPAGKIEENLIQPEVSTPQVLISIAEAVAQAEGREGSFADATDSIVGKSLQPTLASDSTLDNDLVNELAGHSESISAKMENLPGNSKAVTETSIIEPNEHVEPVNDKLTNIQDSIKQVSPQAKSLSKPLSTPITIDTVVLSDTITSVSEGNEFDGNVAMLNTFDSPIHELNSEVPARENTLSDLIANLEFSMKVSENTGKSESIVDTSLNQVLTSEDERDSTRAILIAEGVNIPESTPRKLNKPKISIVNLEPVKVGKSLLQVNKELEQGRLILTSSAKQLDGGPKLGKSLSNKSNQPLFTFMSKTSREKEHQHSLEVSKESARLSEESALSKSSPVTRSISPGDNPFQSILDMRQGNLLGKTKLSDNKLKPHNSFFPHVQDGFIPNDFIGHSFSSIDPHTFHLLDGIHPPQMTFPQSPGPTINAGAKSVLPGPTPIQNLRTLQNFPNLGLGRNMRQFLFTQRNLNLQNNG